MTTIQQEDLIGMLTRDPVFLFDLQPVNASLDVATTFGVELVPAGLQRVINLRGGFGHEHELLGVHGHEARRNHGLSRARPAGQHDSLHCQ